MHIRLNRPGFSGVPVGNQVRHFHCRAFTEIVNIRFKRQTKAGDFDVGCTFARGSQAICQCRFHALHHPVRFAVVHFTRRADNSCQLRVLRNNEPRINRNTMPAHTRTRLQNIYPRMAVRQADQFPDVNALRIANQRQFVSKGNVYVTETVFRQLAHFGSAGVGNNTFAFEKNVIQIAGTP